MDIETSYQPRRRMEKGPSRWLLFLLGAFLLLGIGITGGLWYQEQASNHEKADPLALRGTPVLYQAEWVPEQDVTIINDELYFSLNYMKEQVDPHIVWDETSNSAIITTKNKVLQFVEGQVEAFMNGKPFSLRFAVEDINGVKFIPARPLEQIFPFRVKRIKDTGIWIKQEKQSFSQRKPTSCTV